MPEFFFFLYKNKKCKQKYPHARTTKITIVNKYDIYIKKKRIYIIFITYLCAYAKLY